jgi:hypothetical protein
MSGSAVFVAFSGGMRRLICNRWHGSSSRRRGWSRIEGVVGNPDSSQPKVAVASCELHISEHAVVEPDWKIHG